MALRPVALADARLVVGVAMEFGLYVSRVVCARLLQACAGSRGSTDGGDGEAAGKGQVVMSFHSNNIALRPATTTNTDTPDTGAAPSGTPAADATGDRDSSGKSPDSGDAAETAVDPADDLGVSRDGLDVGASMALTGNLTNFWLRTSGGWTLEVVEMNKVFMLRLHSTV